MNDKTPQKTISHSSVSYDGIVEKSDLNGYGMMHGGRLLTLCDEIGYLAAKKHAEVDCLTRAAHNVQFSSMMKENESFSIQAKVVLTGKTTLWVACRVTNARKTVMSAVFVFIAVDKAFKSIPVLPVQAESSQEKSEQALMQQLLDQVTEKNRA
ncbi:MAG: hotdog domain-containing protein [Mariprofundaceae bacterium]